MGSVTDFTFIGTPDMTTELRVNISDDLLSFVDGLTKATGKSRAEIMTELITDLRKRKIHEAIVLCRLERINPLEMERERQ